MERKKITWPSNYNKLGPTHEFNPDLNPAWIQKQAKGWTQIWYEIHIKFLGFQSSLKYLVPNNFFYCGTQWFWIWITESGFKLRVPNTHLGIQIMNHQKPFSYYTPLIILHIKRLRSTLIMGPSLSLCLLNASALWFVTCEDNEDQPQPSQGSEEGRQPSNQWLDGYDWNQTDNLLFSSS